MITRPHIEKAAQRIADYLIQTPCVADLQLSEEIGVTVFSKMEMYQVSGSFKSRGAFNKLLSLEEHQRREGFFVAASTGNHAAAFCTALRQLGLKGKVFLPESISPSKLDYIKSFGVPYEMVGRTSLHAELHCRKVANENGYEMVHPYNDPEIVAGQGTVGREILAQVENPDLIVVPVGGGGLISGIVSWVKSNGLETHIVGCQPEQSPEMVASIRAGQIIEEDISNPTLSDGTAGGMEPGSITFPISRDGVDEWSLITENEIAFEIREMILKQQIIIEGAAALPLAYIRKNAKKWQGKKAVLVLTGKRISPEKLKGLIC